MAHPHMELLPLDLRSGHTRVCYFCDLWLLNVLRGLSRKHADVLPVLEILPSSVTLPANPGRSLLEFSCRIASARTRLIGPSKIDPSFFHISAV